MEKIVNISRISTKKAQKVLTENGLVVDDSTAEKILDYLYLLANITVNQISKEKNIKQSA